LGYDPSEKPHKISAWKEIVNEEDLGTVEKAIENHLSDPNTEFDEVIRYRHKKGYTVWIRCKGMAIRNENGQPVRMLGAHTDISKLVRKEKFLERCNSAAQIGYWELNLENNELYWSDTIKEIHDLPNSYEPDLETAISFFPSGKHREAILSAVQEAREKGTPYDLQLELQIDKERRIWVRSIGYAEFFNGKCVRLYGTMQDIDTQKRTELALKESKDRFFGLVENIPGATYQYTVIDEGGDMVFMLEYMSGHVKELTGYGADEFMGEENLIINRIIHKEDVERVSNFVRNAIEKKEGWQVDYRIIHKNGSVRWINERGNVLPGEAENSIKLIGVMMDQTGQVKVQKQLAREKKLLRTIIDNVPVNIYMKDNKRRKILANKAEVEYSGFETEEEVLGKTDEELYPDEIAKNYMIEDKQVLEEGESLRGIENDMGFGRWAIVSKIPLTDSNGDVESIVGISIDITERKKAEKRLKDALSKLQSILAASTRVGIISTDKDGMITSFNRGAENLLGYDAEEVIDMDSPLTSYLKLKLKKAGVEVEDVQNSSVSRTEIVRRFIKKTKFQTKEWELVRKDGSTFPAQLTITEIIGEDGALSGYLGIVSDISELKRRENELRHLLDINKEQNERLLNFAHIVSHNLKGHGANFAMILDLLELEKDPEEILQFVKMLRSASNNLDETVKNLTQVVESSTRPKDSLKPVKIRKELDKAMGSLSAIIRSADANIDIEADSNAVITAIPAYVESIFHNLLSNAIKYRSRNRKPRIRIKVSATKEYRVISFEDNGQGLDLEKHGGSLFGMYNTFHGNEDARGVGLFITKNQIDAMGGSIEVESEPDKGSVFRVYLPK
jgi:PAS domain S-box-containing protein